MFESIKRFFARLMATADEMKDKVEDKVEAAKARADEDGIAVSGSNKIDKIETFQDESQYGVRPTVDPVFSPQTTTTVGDEPLQSDFGMDSGGLNPPVQTTTPVTKTKTVKKTSTPRKTTTTVKKTTQKRK